MAARRQGALAGFMAQYRVEIFSRSRQGTSWPEATRNCTLNFIKDGLVPGVLRAEETAGSGVLQVLVQIRLQGRIRQGR